MAGRQVTYVIRVTNTGDSTFTSLEVIDTISPVIVNQASAYPAGFSEAVTNVPGVGTKYVWSNPSLAMNCGESYTFTLTGDVGVVCADTWVTNEAVATANGAEPVRAGAGCTALDSRPGIGVSGSWINAATGTQSPAPQRGTTVRYTISISNQGWSTGYNVEWIDTVPALVNTVTYGTVPAGWTVLVLPAVGATVFALGRAQMSPGETATFSFSAVVASTEAGVFDATNRVGATFDGPCDSVPSGYDYAAVPSLARIPLTTLANETAVGPLKKDSSIVYPSPARGEKAFVAFYLDVAAVVKVRVYNQQGILLDTVEEYRDAGPAQLAVSTGRLAPGIYYYTVEVNVPGGRTMHKPRKLVVAR
jgi:uncharacterized repeat protein (TIGR01451 family)